MSEAPGDGVALNSMSHAEAPAPALPRWESHTRVAADKITGVSEGEGMALFRWHLACGVAVAVDELLASRVPPNTSPIGGYYLLYDRDLSLVYESWSPAEEFEAGYTRVATEA